MLNVDAEIAYVAEMRKSLPSSTLQITSLYRSLHNVICIKKNTEKKNSRVFCVLLCFFMMCTVLAKPTIIHYDDDFGSGKFSIHFPCVIID